MNMIKSLIIAMTSLLFLLAPSTVMAQATDPLAAACEQGAESSLCQDTSAENPLFGPNGVITKVTQIVTIIVGAAAVIMIIVGGLRYVLSSGDANNVNGAKNTILYALIGLVIALIAQAIVLFVLRQI